jgi:hypothetical protein
VATAVTLHEGGEWIRFPDVYGKISVRCFLDNVEFHPEGKYANLCEFNYGGIPLYFHSVKFCVPFKGNDTTSPHDIFDAGVWKMTNFQTPWRDELKAWEDL